MDDIQIDTATVTRKGVRFTIRRLSLGGPEGWEVSGVNPTVSHLRNANGELRISPVPTFDLALSLLDPLADRINEIEATVKAADRLLKETGVWCRSIEFGPPEHLKYPTHPTGR